MPPSDLTRRPRRRRFGPGTAVSLAAIVAGVSLAYALESSAPPRPKAKPKPIPRLAFIPARAPVLHQLPPPAPPAVQAQLAISAAVPLRPVPASYLGISTEYWSLPLWGKHLPLLERVLALVHGPGRLVLRIGGDSADRTFWASGRKMPGWAYQVTPEWLREVGAIVSHTGARVILDLNLVTATPAVAATWALVAAASLPPHSILGFEIGNEPDLYSPGLWLAGVADKLATPALPAAITPAGYATSFRAYARALAVAVPRAPLFGPALGEPELNLSWLKILLARPHPGLREVTVHRYPYWGCAPQWLPSYPTISRLLSEQATAGMAESVLGAVRVAHRAGLPLRLTELNSVNCGGVAGVSDAFATALWAPDALFELLRAGVNGVSIHVRAEAINAAFAIGPHGLDAHPLLYGMVLFRRMLGAHPALVALRLHTRPRYHLKAWAVRSGRVLRVLLLDKGGRSLTVGLDLPGRGRATVERLLAPSARSTGGVTLAGQHLGADGRWRGRRVVTTLRLVPGTGYVLRVRRYSAALVTIRLRAGALRGRA